MDDLQLNISIPKKVCRSMFDVFYKETELLLIV